MVADLSPKQLAQLKYQELKLNEKKLRLIEGLPHRYQWKWYNWARAFFESTNKTNLLCAANQISKSSTQIRKCIEWATNKELWPKLWKTKPQIFFYLYPDKQTATIEFQKKWIPEFLPRGEMKGHPIYGWTAEFDNKKINAVHFNSGVSVYFKTYAQDVQNLQASSVHAVFTDEELPVELYPELRMRMAATDGYFSMCFTATLNQDFWRRAMEGTGKEEVLPEAFKQTVSMYDCLCYEDGTPGAYNDEKIDRIKAQCGSDIEVQRRIYGRFVTEIGRVYPSFSADRHYISSFHLRSDHKVYAGVDIGGGGSAHPAAITFVAVEPDFKRATVFKGWRGDGVTTTMSDILEKFREMRGGIQCLGQAYDYAAKDFGTLAQRMGENFQKAEKNHEIGEGMLNALFKNAMLHILDTDELRKLGGEFSSLMFGKNAPKNDFIDSCRYALARVPFDWSDAVGEVEELKEKVIEDRPLTQEEYLKWEMRQRRGIPDEPEEGESWGELDTYFEEWNDEYGN